MDPLTLMSIAQSAPGVVQGLTNLFSKRKSFGNTAYGQRLKQLMQTGSISGAERNALVGGTARTAGATLGRAKSDYVGRLAAMGMSGSIAAQRGMNELDQQAAEQISATERGIGVENAKSKAEAANKFAEAQTAYEEAARQEKNQAIGSLVGEIASGVGAYGKGKYEEYLSDKKFNQERQLKGMENAARIKEAQINALSRQKPEIMDIINNMDNMTNTEFNAKLLGAGLNQEEIDNLIVLEKDRRSRMIPKVEVPELPNTIR